MVEDCHHFLLVCPKYRDLRNKLFKPYFCKWPTINTFTSLMETDDKKVIVNTAKFINVAWKQRC